MLCRFHSSPGIGVFFCEKFALILPQINYYAGNCFARHSSVKKDTRFDKKKPEANICVVLTLSHLHGAQRLKKGPAASRVNKSNLQQRVGW